MKGWVIPPKENSHFVAAMEQVLDVYKRPYNKSRPVVCMDETPKQLIKEVRRSLPARPGSEERVDYEYSRCGVCNVVNRKKKYSDFGKMKCSKFGNKSAVFSGTILQ